jgi:Concanavalin A-like lectin/glucanases superfamily/Bacterial Ig domain
VFPTVSVSAPTSGATVSGTVSLAATAADNVGVVGVQFKVDGTNVGAEDTSSPFATSWISSSVANGTHSVTAVARDAAGNVTTSAPVPITVSNAAPTGLVGAFGFDEVSGASVADRSGLGNNGTVSGASRSTAGRYGGALSFDGVNDSVSVPDAASLDLTNNMTLSAWVRPTGSTDWRTVLLKERPGGQAYSLYASSGVAAPSGTVAIGGSDQEVLSPSELPANAWSHLAFTYDGSFMRLYVNGLEVSSKPQTGNAPVSTGALKIGGNAVWGEWFAGLIDEVRLYNRALTSTQLQTDMATPINP